MPRSKKHTYSKKEIDRIYKHSFYYKGVVRLTKENNKLHFDKTTKEDGNKSKQNNTSIDETPVKKKEKLDINGIDILKLEFREGGTQIKSKIESSSKPNKEIVSTRTEDISMVIDCASESKNSSAVNIRPKIWVVDPKKMIRDDEYKPLTKELLEPSTIENKTYLSSNKVNGAKPPLSGKNHVKWNLIKIEKIHKEYFEKSVQITIVTVANILNVISISNEYLQALMDESTKKKSEAEKIKYICYARQLHECHNKILNMKLKKKVLDIASSFEGSEFYSAFVMFFLSILTVLRVLNRKKFGNVQDTFDIVKKVLLEILINNKHNHPNIFSTFQSTTFHFDCTNVLSVINDGQDKDPGIIYRMPLYFLRAANGLKYFEGVIKAVTRDSEDNLSVLIENATFQCYYCSEILNPMVSSTVQHSNYNELATEKTQSQLIGLNKSIIHSIFAKNKDGNYQDVPVLNGNKSQVIVNTAVEQSIVTSQPLTSFHKPHFSLLQKKTSEVIPTKKSIVVTPTTTNSPLVQVTSSSSETATLTPPTTTCETFQLTIQDKKSVANSYIHRAECSTILVDNKEYQLIKDSSGQLRAVYMPTISNSSLIQVTASSSETATSTTTITTCQSVNGPSGQMRAVDNVALVLAESLPTVIIRCDEGHCNNFATITCKCRKVNYCSDSCRTRHWYVHYADCAEGQTLNFPLHK